MRLLFLSSIAFFLLGLSKPIKIASFNLESGDAQISYLVKDIEKLSKEVGIWGFQESQVNWPNVITDSLKDIWNDGAKSIIGTTGGTDRLVIVYNSNRYQLLDSYELKHINIGGRVRAPLVAKFLDLSNGIKFFFMNNHLYRSNNDRRHEQASLLNEWASQQQLPVLAVGDYNFDYSVDESYHDEGFDNLTDNNIFSWVKPTPLIKTQCSPRYNSILDFIFASGEAQNWEAKAAIHFTNKEYCNKDKYKSDHRPISAIFGN